MGLRLQILSWWTPQFFIRKQLSSVSDQTLSALEGLLAEYAPYDNESSVLKSLPRAGIDEQRAAMGTTQARLVDALEAAVGREQAVKLCRNVLFTVGQNLGADARSGLGIGDSQQDLMRAVTILYRILGIEIELERIDETNVKLHVNRCPFVEQYSELGCEVFSATDEGAITGLQPHAAMKFTQYLTQGCAQCTADIHNTDAEVTR